MKHETPQAGIEKTRSEMSGTINEIEARLSPAHLREQVMEQIDIAKESLREHMKEELRGVKEDVKGELREAKQVVKDEISEVKQELRQEYQEAKAAVRAATIGKVETMVQNASDTVTDVKTTFVDTIRANPIPAALVGVGLVWLLASARSNTTSRTSSNNRMYGDRMYGDRMNGNRMNGNRRDIGVVERGQQVVGSALHKVQDATTGAATKVRDAAGAAGDAVNAFAHDAKDAVTGLAHQAGEAAQHAGESVSALATQTQASARQMEQRFETTLHENPLAFGAVAFAIGTAVGLAIPSSQREDSLMGTMRDQLLEQAEHLAHDAVATAQEKVTQAIGSATSQGNQEGKGTSPSSSSSARA